jgi:uncharacterized membrane protein YkvA (DUF1232 family)
MVDSKKKAKKPAKNTTQKAKPSKKKISEVIEKTKNKAEEYARDPKKAKKLLEDAVKKAKGYEKNRGPLGEVWSYLTALFRLLKAYSSGKYRDIPWSSMVLVIVAIIYFVSPVDLIPDVIAGIGFLDDAAVIGIVVAQIKADLDNFLAWEIAQSEGEEA